MTWRPSSEWIKASASNPSNNCVYARQENDGRISIMDSKLGGASPILTFTPAEIQAFMQGVVDGDFDKLLHPPGTAHSSWLRIKRRGALLSFRKRVRGWLRPASPTCPQDGFGSDHPSPSTESARATAHVLTDGTEQRS
ncbi:DUF397 domain-containing protein [Kribbella sp. NBC_01245]|uniref:DUF397 domain-containing protein n=1 Tax=Kribbella sp. NBC_01245 TaxID=2903578 RepID=UPI003FA5FBF1